MSDLKLIIGNKNYSSWSLRPWLLLRHLGLEFDEYQLRLDTPEFTHDIPNWSPTRRVPALHHGSLVIWDSLAICEYACELAGGGLPEDRAARAVARSIAAEMHAGFTALRERWPMNARADRRRVPATPDLTRDLTRIEALWADCRQRFGTTGPWLFGSYSLADAMYAPVVLRFRTYGERFASPTQDYLQTALSDPHLREWLAAARAEPWMIAAAELGAAQATLPG
ncbi:MAG TPA: glutathione S-transferase family protein [Steroidobacteraceae bacterium]|nr:glutathione S-transferase family protein [Steroidobacteraceae bacterium]HRX88788.1 glutathione S-transferase family protein [Steroidobacteraceae bacterium]